MHTLYRVWHNSRNRFAFAAKVAQQAGKTPETRHKSVFTVGRITRYVRNGQPPLAQPVDTALPQPNRCDAVNWCHYGWLHTLLRSPAAVQPGLATDNGRHGLSKIPQMAKFNGIRLGDRAAHSTRPWWPIQLEEKRSRNLRIATE